MPSLTEKVAVNIRKLRLRAHLTQEQVAAKAGISVSYVSMLERGQRSPPLDTLESLAKTLGCSYAALMQ